MKHSLALLFAIICISADAETHFWDVNGQRREALMQIPTSGSKDKPVLFFWHGYGGTAKAAAERYQFEKLWPEAVVVYPQGVMVARKVRGVALEKFGWQLTTEEFAGRDVAFFDAMLKTLVKEHGVNSGRIFCAGHSNGGRFTQILWALRADKLAAVAPSGSNADAALLARLKPLPCFHIAGEKDEIVPFARQSKTIEHLRRLNLASGTRFEAWAHPGGHAYPTEGPARVVTFFKQLRP